MKNTANPPRLMFAATGSGAGKTTITCAILKVLSDRKVNVHSFKCGPDYIGPMFHKKVLNTPSSNLDIFMSGEEGVKFLLAKNAAGCDISIIEGVMGLYDGMSTMDDISSSNHLAMVTNTPTVLIVNVKGMSLSLSAMVKGYMDLLPNKISGVILNNCTAGMYPVYKEMLMETLGIRAYGYMPNVPKAVIGSRHLGLITAGEITDLNQKLDLLSKTAEECIDIEGLMALAKSAEEFEYEDLWKDICADEKVRIAIADDEAFCFFYEDTFRILEEAGAELVRFSPIRDNSIPENVHAVMFYGGYPEIYAKKLSINTTMIKSIREAYKSGLPVYAECGGFMYLLSELTDTNGDLYTSVGLISGGSKMTKKLQRFGYQTIEAKADNILCERGEKINVHEFHYSESTNNGSDFIASKKGRSWECIHARDNLFAGYPHLNLASYPHLAQRFIEKCVEYKKTLEGCE